MSTNEFDFSSHEWTEIPVKGPDGKSYILREASGDVAARYRNAQMACTKINPETGKLSGLAGVADLEPFLVSLCLITEDRKPVGLNLIRGWASRVVKSLYEGAREISDLAEDSKERELLAKVLTLPDSPVSYPALEEWVESQKDKEFQPLRVWIKSPEDAAGNAPSDLEGGSD